jgi:hypothetical protein
VRKRTLASYLPYNVLRFLNRHWKLSEDPADGWTFWLDADYYKYVRREHGSR